MRRGFRITGIARITAVFAAIVLSGFICLRIIAVNRAYPAALVESYSLGDKFDFHGAQISVESVEVCRTSDIIEGYVCDLLDKHGEPLSDDDCKVLVVTVAAENATDGELKLPLQDAVAESGGWHNGLALTEFCALNEGLTWPTVRLSAGEAAEFKLAFKMYSVQFKKGEWEHVGEREFDVVFSVYPVKRVVEVGSGV